MGKPEKNSTSEKEEETEEFETTWSANQNTPHSLMGYSSDVFERVKTTLLKNFQIHFGNDVVITANIKLKGQNLIIEIKNINFNSETVELPVEYVFDKKGVLISCKCLDNKKFNELKKLKLNSENELVSCISLWINAISTIENNLIPEKLKPFKSIFQSLTEEICIQAMTVALICPEATKNLSMAIFQTGTYLSDVSFQKLYCEEIEKILSKPWGKRVGGVMLMLLGVILIGLSITTFTLAITTGLPLVLAGIYLGSWLIVAGVTLGLAALGTASFLGGIYTLFKGKNELQLHENTNGVLGRKMQALVTSVKDPYQYENYLSDHFPLQAGNVVTWNIMTQGRGRNNGFGEFENPDMYYARLEMITIRIKEITQNDKNISFVFLQEVPLEIPSKDDFFRILLQEQVKKSDGWQIASEKNLEGHFFGNMILYDENKFKLDEELTHEIRQKINQKDENNPQSKRSLVFVFEDKTTKEKFLVVNVHHRYFDENGKDAARYHQADVLKFCEVAKENKLNLILGGDFNTNPTSLSVPEGASLEIKFVMNQGSIIRENNKTKMQCVDCIISQDKNSSALLEDYARRSLSEKTNQPTP